MKRRSFSEFRVAIAFLAVPFMAILAAQVHQAAFADEDSEGRVVQIAPDRPDNQQAEEEIQAEEAAEPAYWIGLQGIAIDSPALRTHLQLADDVGVLVVNIVPDSPADQAGLRQHDVIVAVNGEPISDVKALQQVVAEGGKKPIELKVIRLAKESTVKVTPEERPKDVASTAPGRVEGGPMGELERFFQQGGVPGMRFFGNGMIVQGQPFDVNQMPGGLSINIAREGDGPAKITVKKGDQTWNIRGDDEKAIKQLPDDVRPFVESMLQRSQNVPGGPEFKIGGDLLKILPDQLGNFQFNPDNDAFRQRAEAIRERTEAASKRLMKRLEEMERRLQQLEQFQQDPPADRTNPADDPSKT